MANEYGFFAAKNHDRRYSAEDFCALFKDFFTDGVYGKDTNGFAVSSAGDMDISVGGGTAYIQGRWLRKSSPQVIEIGSGDTVYGRYDGVVIRCDYEKREVYIAVNEGIPSGTPEKPAPRRDESAYEIVLAYIYVGANSVEVTQANIEDTRGDSALCGWVTGAVDRIDTTGLFAQYEAQWELLKAACAQDSAAVIEAWARLNAVKTVNGIEPSDGNIALVLDDIPDTGNYYKSGYFIQAGKVTSASSPTASVTFPKRFGSTPFILLAYPTAAAINYVPVVTSASASGFNIKKNSTNTYDSVNWIAFGKLPT